MFNRKNSPVKSSGSGLFFEQKLLITNLVSLFIIDLFKFAISTWVNFGYLCVSKNLFITSKLSTLLTWSCSYFYFIILLISVGSVMMCFFFHSWFWWSVFSLFFLWSLAKSLTLFIPFVGNIFWFYLFSLLLFHFLFNWFAV